MTATAQLLEALRKRYIKRADFPGGLFIPEVGQNGGANQQRCDAVYVGFTSASGRLMVGHELKVSRADWLHELKQIDKADRWADACHEWWLVVADRAIVHDGELPAGWGLLAPGRGGTLHVYASASRKLDFSPPWWAVRSVMARWDTLATANLARRAQQAEQKAWEVMEERVTQRVAAQLDRATDDATAAITELALIHDILGLRVSEGTVHRYRGAFDDQKGPTPVSADELRDLGQFVGDWARWRDALAALTPRFGGPLHEATRALTDLQQRWDALTAAPDRPLPAAPSTYDHV